MARITDTAVAGLEKDPADWRAKEDTTPGPMPKRPSRSSPKKAKKAKKASPEPDPQPTIEDLRNSAVDKALGGREMDVEELESRQMERFRASEGEGGGVYAPGGGRRATGAVFEALGLPSVGPGVTPTRDMDDVRRRHGAMESIDVPAGGGPSEYTTRHPSDPPSPYKHTLAEEGSYHPKDRTWMERGIEDRGPETLKMLEEKGDASARMGAIGDKGRATKGVREAQKWVDHHVQELDNPRMWNYLNTPDDWRQALTWTPDDVFNVYGAVEKELAKEVGGLEAAKANLKQASEVAKKKLAELKNLPKMADFHPKDAIRALQNVDIKAAARGLVDDPFTLIALANVPGMMFVSGLPDTTENYRTLARMGSDTRAPGPLKIRDLNLAAREELSNNPELVLELYESGHISEELRNFLDVGPRFQYAPLEE
jgi:hypothetical protein